MISFKQYFMESKSWIGISLMTGFFVFLILMSIFCKDYAFYGYWIPLILAYFIFMTVIYSIIKSNYNVFLKDLERYKKITEERKELYNNMTFDDFINILYEENIIDLDLIKCPRDYTEEQSKEYLENYVLNLKNKENINKNV